ncbi:hypothetical protein Gohar_019379 [Gossypium harknessii]|uniref:Uncharacterized protein n=1 Tax=Gossypium harknessii TaxID=34285 RepID=A0A7J9IFV1_9ROSI|nr:hypothetical protein [Gossypium harknessii]
MFGSREYPITGVFYFRLKKRYLGISIPFPLHRLPIHCHMNPILPSQILTSKTFKRQPFLARIKSSFNPSLEPRQTFPHRPISPGSSVSLSLS